MKKYEAMIVLKPEMTEEAVKEVVDRAKATIEKSGEIVNVDEWGKRKLAYTIAKKYTEGYYVLIEFNAATEVLTELEHNFRINENILRHMIINKEN